MRVVILEMGHKLLTGIIVSSAVIFSIFKAEMIFHDWIGQFYNAVVFELLLHFVIVFLGLIALYKLFNRNNETIRKYKTQLNSQTRSVNWEAITISFVDGFKMGLIKK